MKNNRLINNKNFIKYMKRYLPLIILFLVLPLISAVLTFERGQEITLNLPCESANGSFCPASVVCNLSLAYPNGSLYINNSPMSNSGNGLPSITINDSSILGEHRIFYGCCEVDECDTADLPMFITETGHSQSISEAIGSSIFLILMICLTIIIGWIGFRLSETEKLWVLGVFFIVLALFLLTYDFYLGFEYRLNNTGANNDASVIEILFWSFLIFLSAGLMTAIVIMLKKWEALVKWFKGSLKGEEEGDDWDNNVY